jgi:HEAT repeat protein
MFLPDDRILEHGLAVLLLALPLGAGSGDDFSTQETDLASLVMQQVRSGSGLDENWLHDRLIAEPAASLEHVAIALEEHDATCSPSGNCVHLTAESRDALGAELRRLARRMAEDMQRDPEKREIHAARGLELCALAGGAEEMGLALGFVSLVEGEPRSSRLDARLQFAVRHMLRRSPGAWRELETALRGSLPSPVWARLIQAVGDEGSERAILLLAGILDRRPELDRTLLSQINRLADAHGSALDEGRVARVRGKLSSSDATVRRQTAELLGRLHDSRSVESLLGLLKIGEAGVRKSAHWALRRITGLTMRPEDPRWHTWYEQELLWWEGRSAHLRNMLRNGSDPEVIAAMNEISPHRLHAEEIAAEFEALTLDHRPMVASTACSILGSLGRAASLPALLEGLQHRDPRVRDSAHRALKRMTGLPLPPNAALWRETLTQDHAVSSR